MEDILKQTEEKMNKSINSFEQELGQIRTGRANAQVLDNINVMYYGSLTPIRQTMQISIPEPSQLYLVPYDKSILKDIENAILQSNLGITPQSDSNGIRLVFPKMTEERRKELVKTVSKYEEQAKVSIRNIRRDINDILKKSKELTEDDLKNLLDHVQKITDKMILKIEDISKHKSNELMSI